MKTRSILLACVLTAAPTGGCAAMRADMGRTATALAWQELGCGLPNVEALEEWSFRAETACGAVRYYRCGVDAHARHRGVAPHFDCHGHATEAEVVGFFHPADEPGHR